MKIKNKFIYEDEIKIIDGFYKGKSGKIVSMSSEGFFSSVFEIFGFQIGEYKYDIRNYKEGYRIVEIEEKFLTKIKTK